VDDAARAIHSDIGSRHKAEEALSLEAPEFEEKNGRRLAIIRLNRRLRPTDEVPEVLGQMKQQAMFVAKTAGTVAVDVMVRQENQQMYNGRATVIKRIVQAWETEPFSTLMDRARQALAAASVQATPGKWQLGRLGMGTAGSVFVKEFGIPTIGFGPGEEDTAHCVNESVAIDKVVEAVYGSAAIVHSLIGIPVWGWTSDEI